MISAISSTIMILRLSMKCQKHGIKEIKMGKSDRSKKYFNVPIDDLIMHGYDLSFKTYSDTIYVQRNLMLLKLF